MIIVDSGPPEPLQGRFLFGWLLRRTRERVGFTMGELSRAAGFSVSEISGREIGRLEPFTDAQIRHIAYRLGVLPDNLLGAAKTSREEFKKCHGGS